MNNFLLIEAAARNRQAEFRREAAHERRSREAQGFEPRRSFLRQLFDLLGAARPRWSASETRAPAAGSQLNDCVAC